MRRAGAVSKVPGSVLGVGGRLAAVSWRQCSESVQGGRQRPISPRQESPRQKSPEAEDRRAEAGTGGAWASTTEFRGGPEGNHGQGKLSLEAQGPKEPFQFE